MILITKFKINLIAEKVYNQYAVNHNQVVNLKSIFFKERIY